MQSGFSFKFIFKEGQVVTLQPPPALETVYNSHTQFLQLPSFFFSLNSKEIKK